MNAHASNKIVKIACMCLIYEIKCLRVITAYLDLFRIPKFGETQLFSVSILYKLSPIKYRAENNCKIIRYGKTQISANERDFPNPYPEFTITAIEICSYFEFYNTPRDIVKAPLDTFL